MYDDYYDEDERDYDAPYEEPVYSKNKDENSINRITKFERDVEKAKEFMAGPGGDMAREVALETVNMNDMGSDSKSFLTDLNRRIRAYNRTNDEQMRKVNDHVAVVIRRMLAAEFPAYREFMSISRAGCDEILYRSDRERYAWLNEFYGGALDHGGNDTEAA